VLFFFKIFNCKRPQKNILKKKKFSEKKLRDREKKLSEIKNECKLKFLKKFLKKKFFFEFFFQKKN